MARFDGRQEPHLFRLWQQRRRHAADHRSREAVERSQGADAGELLYPQIHGSNLSAGRRHTVYPMLGMPIDEFAGNGFATRDIVMIVNEATRNECKPQAREMVFFADITVETHPMVVSNYTVKEKTGHFCDRGGRFGAHSSQESMRRVLQEARHDRVLQCRAARP